MGMILLLGNVSWAGLEMGQVPQQVELRDKRGERVQGGPWSSEELKGKVHVLFYVDPDKKDLNNEASEALNAEKFSFEKFQSVAIINMAATWLPNFAISSALKEKQKRYPKTIYVRDYQKVLVKEWGLTDDQSNVLAFDKQGRLIFRKDGKLDPKDIQTLIRAIHRHLDE
jgi:hypothetical protein